MVANWFGMCAKRGTDPVIHDPSAVVRPCCMERCRKPERNTRVGWTSKEKLRCLVQSTTPQSQNKRHVLLDSSASTTAWTLNQLQKSVGLPCMKSTIGRFHHKIRVRRAMYLVTCPSSLPSHLISRTDLCKNPEKMVVILRAGPVGSAWMEGSSVRETL